MHMAADSESIDYQGYDTPTFVKITKSLHEDCGIQIRRTQKLISKLDGGGAIFEYSDKSDVLSDIKALQKSRLRFMAAMKKLNSGKPIKLKEIETSYDAYCYSLAMVEAHADKWEVVIANDFIKKIVGHLKYMSLLTRYIGTAGKDVEKALKSFEKDLKKAEKAETVSYIKAGLSIALDVAIAVSPQVRALSVVTKIVIGGTISVSSNLLFDNPKDYVGTTLGITVSGAEVEYTARDLTKASKALGLAGKALKYDGLVGAATNIQKSRKTVKEIKARIAALQKILDSKAKFLMKWAKDVERTKAEILKLIRRMQANADKADHARETYQTYKALRDSL